MIGEECRCDCHNNRDRMETRHIAPCCHRCQYCHRNIICSRRDSHETTCNMRKYYALEIELGFFDQKREEWCNHYTGKFALIKGITVHGFYDTQERAYEVGCDVWGLIPFLIKEVQLKDRVIFMPDRVISIDVLNETPDDYVI